MTMATNTELLTAAIAALGTTDLIARFDEEGTPIVMDLEEKPISAAKMKKVLAELAKEPVDTPEAHPLKRWQFKAMVAYLGKADAIVTAINAMPDALTRAVVMARYENSDVYNREDPLFDQLAPAVGLTPEQIDDAWMTIVGQSA